MDIRDPLRGLRAILFQKYHEMFETSFTVSFLLAWNKFIGLDKKSIEKIYPTKYKSVFWYTTYGICIEEINIVNIYIEIFRIYLPCVYKNVLPSCNDSIIKEIYNA